MTVMQETPIPFFEGCCLSDAFFFHKIKCSILRHYQNVYLVENLNPGPVYEAKTVFCNVKFNSKRFSMCMFVVMFS